MILTPTHFFNFESKQTNELMNSSTDTDSGSEAYKCTITNHHKCIETNYKEIIIDFDTCQVNIKYYIQKDYNHHNFNSNYTFEQFKKELTQYFEYSNDYKLLVDDNEEGIIEYQVPYLGISLLEIDKTNLYWYYTMLDHLYLFRYVLRWDHGDVALRNICFSPQGYCHLIDFDNFNRLERKEDLNNLMLEDEQEEHMWLVYLKNDLERYEITTLIIDLQSRYQQAQNKNKCLKELVDKLYQKT